MKLSILPGLLLLLVVGHTTHAQEKSNDTTARYFIIQASIGNLQEIAMAQVAVSKAVDPQVKAFAQRMVTDHGQAQAKLVQLINARHFPIPAEATDPPKENPMLAKMAGKDFDRMYVHMMVPSHRQTVQLFEKYAMTGKDPDAAAYARQSLPVLKEHLASITAIDKQLPDPAAK